MEKSHLEKNIVALLSACFRAVKMGNEDHLKSEEKKQGFRNVRSAIINLMLDIIYPKNDGIGLSPAQSFGYVDKSFTQLHSLKLRQGQDIRKIFDKISIIAMDADLAIKYGFISAMDDGQFDRLLSRLQDEVATAFNVESFSLKLELERQEKDEHEKLMTSFGRRVFKM